MARLAARNAQPPANTFPIAEAQLKEWLRLFQAGDPATPAFHYLMVLANRRLQGLLDDGVERGVVLPRLAWDEGRKATYFQFVPDSLLGALWLQFAGATGGGKEYRECECCRRLFEVSPQAHRKSRQFCSHACKTRMHRSRQDRARKMFFGGKTVEEIAVELGSEPAKVEGWIKGGKG